MGQHYKFSPALIVHSLALIPPLPVNALPNILAANVPYNIPRNSPFCSFDLFLIFSLIPFNNNPYSSSDLTIIFSISSKLLIQV